MAQVNRLYDGDVFEYRGRTFRVAIDRDDCSGKPWEECDGHGVVSDWRHGKDKAPGERILSSDRGSYRFYDVVETMAIAKRDGWGCGIDSHNHKTAKEKAACAVEQDYEYLRAWCANEWFYAFIGVGLLDDEDDNSRVRDCEETEHLGGVEYGLDSFYPHVWEIARELADKIMARVEVDEPQAHYSEN